MADQHKKRWRNVFRIAVCIAALWIVVQGVTLRDHIVLQDGSSNVVGRIIENDEFIRIQLVDGVEKSFSHSEIARDKDGSLMITYGLLSAWSNSHKYFLLLALFIHFPVVFPQALRFRLMLAAQKIKMGYWNCLKLTFAGNFLNFATPLGSNAGDVFKAYFTSLHTDHKTEAVTTVILDRIIGLCSLLLVVSVITLICPADSRLSLFKPYVLTAVIFGIVAAIIYFSPILRRKFLPQSLLAKLPMIEQLQRMDQAARTLAGKPATILAAVGITVFLQATAICAYCTVALALTIQVPLNRIHEFFAFFYTGVVVQALPGPPQGLGTVELTFRYLFADYGSPSQIICMALAIRAIVLVCALPGLLVTLTGSYKPREVTSLDDAMELISDDSRVNPIPEGLAKLHPSDS